MLAVEIKYRGLEGRGLGVFAHDADGNPGADRRRIRLVEQHVGHARAVTMRDDGDFLQAFVTQEFHRNGNSCRGFRKQR